MYIGSLNTSGLLFAVLPECLNNGTNPYLSGNMPSTSGAIWSSAQQYTNGSVFFPIYSPGNNYYGKLRGNAIYSDGILNANNDGYLIVKMPSDFIIENSTEFTIHTKIKLGNFNPGSDVLNTNCSGIDVLNTNCLGIVDYPVADEECNCISFDAIRYIREETITDYMYVYIDTSGTLRDGVLAFRPDYAQFSTSEFIDLTMIKNSSGYFNMYYNGLLLEKEAFANIPWTYGPYNFGKYFGITNLPSVAYYNENQIMSYLVYDRTLDQSEITSIVNTGPTFGGLVGVDNNNGTMSLAPRPIIPTKKYYMPLRQAFSPTEGYIIENNKYRLAIEN